MACKFLMAWIDVPQCSCNLLYRALSNGFNTISSPSYIHLVELLCKFNKRNNFKKRNQFDTAIIEQYAESEGMGGEEKQGERENKRGYETHLRPHCATAGQHMESCLLVVKWVEGGQLRNCAPSIHLPRSFLESGWKLHQPQGRHKRDCNQTGHRD